MAAARLELAAPLRPHAATALVPELTRREFEALLADIGQHGLRDPLDLSEDGFVLDGRARLRAAHELELDSVPVQIVADVAPAEHVLARALLRRQLSPSQKAALAVELDAYRRASAQAHKRQRANLKGQHAEVATLPPRAVRTRELGARIAGVSARTVQDAATVRAADPELFNRVKDGLVSAPSAARLVRRARREAALSAAPPVPEGPFQLVYADPPWQLGSPNGAKAPENHYPTLALEQIKTLGVPVAGDAVLFLWAVNQLLPQALAVIEAWGFEYRTNLVWVKDRIGLGTWARNRHELLLFARRGHYPAPDPEDRPDSVLEAPRGRHSQKPEGFYERIERAYPAASKLELFARQTRPGWAAWGNQLEQP